jgi:four helix bundle protein
VKGGRAGNGATASALLLDVRAKWPISASFTVAEPLHRLDAMKTPVRRHQNLIAWQLCHQLRALVLEYTRSGPVACDYDYRRQLRKAARSACYNTSEGFYRYKRPQARHFMNIAYASLGELLDQIDEEREEKYFTAAQHTAMRRLCLRAMKCNGTLQRSWDRHPPPPGA